MSAHSKPDPANAAVPPKYGDYPELFWDLKPDEPIDVEQPWVLARLLTTAAPDTIRRLAPISLIRREFPNLPLPDHTRRFWEMVFDAMDRLGPRRSPAGA